MKISEADKRRWARAAEIASRERASEIYSGLCSVLTFNFSASSAARMGNQLLGEKGAYSDYQRRHEAYIWPPRDMKPRVAACRFLAGLRKTRPAPKWSNQ